MNSVSFPVKVTGKNSKGKKLSKSLKCKVTVKNPSITLNQTEAALAVNETVKLTASTRPKSAASTVTYTTSDEKVATVANDGTVKAVAEGEATITASAKCGSKTVTATAKVTVGNRITEFKAVKTKQLRVTFAGALDKIDKDNISLVDAKGNKVAIQKATLDDAKTSVMIDLYSALTKDTEYTVTVTVGSKEYKEKLTFVRGAVAKIDAADQMVKAGTAEDIKYTVTDENGLDVTDDTTVSFSSNITITNGKINLAKGVTAIVKVVYVDPTTAKVTESQQFKVTGADEVAETVDAITIGDTAPADDSKWPAEPALTIAKGTTGKKVFVLYTDNFGKKHVAAVGKASFSSLSPDKFTVNSANGEITTNAEGNGDLKVTVDGKEKVFTVTVTAALKGTSLKVATNNAGSMTDAANNPAKVKVNVLDQNGKDFNSDANSNVLTYELISGNADMIASVTTISSGDKNKFTVTAGTEVSIVGAKNGTAVYKVSSNDSSIAYTTVSVEIKAANDKVDHYAFKDVKSEMNKNDAYDGDANTTSDTATIKFVAVNSDGFEVASAQVPAGTITGTAITVTKPDGSQKVVKTLTDSDATLTVDVNAGEFTSEGTYTLVATKGGATLATATFTVKDTGVKPSVTLKKTSEAIGSLGDLTALQALFDIGDGYTLSGVKFTSQNTSLIASATTAVTSIAGLKSSTGDTSVELYNFTAVVTKNGRTYEVNVGTFTVTGVKTA